MAPAYLLSLLSNCFFTFKIIIAVSSLVFVCVVLGCKCLKRKYYANIRTDIRPVKADGKFKGHEVKAVMKADTKITSGGCLSYDVVIVGGGPGGGCCGYYSAKAGLRVALLERKKYPRDKYCGDAICVPAIRILKEMGVMQDLIENGEVEFADSGGFVSPSGLSYIGKSVLEVGEPLAGAVKRTILDNKIVKNAERTGMDLFDECEVENAKFDSSEGMWTVTTATGGRPFHCRWVASRYLVM
eukprot:GHVQ01012982.1.p2 GENE.GHVQ01012982.1~~GHVQ01012982.1.p2  ORF type:complete len:242 (-),score=28.99 GHVQ01012982.1:1192-1917(-)